MGTGTTLRRRHDAPPKKQQPARAATHEWRGERQKKKNNKEDSFSRIVRVCVRVTLSMLRVIERGERAREECHASIGLLVGERAIDPAAAAAPRSVCPPGQRPWRTKNTWRSHHYARIRPWPKPRISDGSNPVNRTSKAARKASAQHQKERRKRMSRRFLKFNYSI